MARKLQREIQQSKPFATLEEEAVLNIARTSDRLQRALHRELKPHGHTPTQYNALRILRGAGDSGMACCQLGERLVSRDPDITRLLGRLEKSGLIERSPHERDHRVVLARITEAGLAKLKTLDPVVAGAIQRLLGHMSPQRLELLIGLMEEARERASEDNRDLEALRS